VLFRIAYRDVSCQFHQVDHNKTKTKEHLREATLASVVKEMAKARIAASVREGIGKTFMTAHAKFCTGELLHNRNTKEDGLVTRVYQLSKGQGDWDIMYEVLVPSRPNTWAASHYVSDWTESILEPSDNATLRD
jgi:hypothetical protein